MSMKITDIGICLDLVLVTISKSANLVQNTFEYSPDDSVKAAKRTQSTLKPMIGRLQTFYLFRT